MPTQEKAVSSIIKSIKNINRSRNMFIVIVMSGPKVFVKMSIKRSLSQNKKATAESSQSKWKSPVKLSSSSYCIKI